MQAQILVDRFLRSELSRHLNVYEKMLLVILASYCGKKSKCFPSHVSLKRDCSMSTDSIKRYTKSLARMGLIEIIRREGQNNLYKLKIPSSNSTECSQRSDVTGAQTLASIAPTSSAPSTANNITNNKKKYTSLINSNTTLPKELMISQSHRELAHTLALNVEEEFLTFKEYHKAKGSVFACWESAFNTWLRKANKFAAQKYSNTTTDVMIGVGHE